MRVKLIGEKRFETEKNEGKGRKVKEKKERRMEEVKNEEKDGKEEEALKFWRK
jgi:hypothetical protein